MFAKQRRALRFPFVHAVMKTIMYAALRYGSKVFIAFMEAEPPRSGSVPIIPCDDDCRDRDAKFEQVPLQIEA